MRRPRGRSHITLVHGTLAHAAEWTAEDAPLRGDLAKALGDHMATTIAATASRVFQHNDVEQPRQAHPLKQGRTSNMNFRYLLGCVLLSVSPLAWCQVATLPTADDFREGEQWTWRQVDESTQAETATFWRRSVVEDDEMVFLSSSKRVLTIDQVYQGLGWREWPLRIGSTWTYSTSWSSPDELPGTTVATAEVVAYESVTVPAGKFMAFRIEYMGRWNLTDAKGRNLSGDLADTYWYAPDVKADVKHRFVSSGKYGNERWISELTGYVRPKR